MSQDMYVILGAAVGYIVALIAMSLYYAIQMWIQDFKDSRYWKKNTYVPTEKLHGNDDSTKEEGTIDNI